MKIGANTFGLKVDLYHDFDGTLHRVREAGIDAIEVCTVPDSIGAEIPKDLPPEVIETLKNSPMAHIFWPFALAKENIPRIREAGFIVDSAHVNLPKNGTAVEAEALASEIGAFAEETGIRYFVTSPMCGLSEMRERAPWLQAVAKRLRNRGLFLLLHNHAQECAAEEGTTAIEYVMEACPDLFLEPDAGWMVAGGMDPVPFMMVYAHRILHLHLKDFFPGKTDQDGDGRFAPIGEGILPLSEVLKASKCCNLSEYGLIIDQDASLGDFVSDLKTGRENVLRLI